MKDAKEARLELRSAPQSSSSSLAEPELIQKPKRLKLKLNPPPSKPPQDVSNIGPPPHSGPIQSTEEGLAAHLRLMTPNERAALRRKPVDMKGKEHRAGQFWNRPGPSPLGRGPTQLIAPIPDSPSPSPSPPSVEDESVINFGPFTPTGSSNSQRSESDTKKSVINIRFIPPKPIPRPKPLNGLLLPYRFHLTYLRPGPAHLPPDLDPKALFSPPKPIININTPYKTIKKALTYLKSELGLTTYPTLTYSLSRVTPGSCSSVEDVIIELDEYVFSISETSSSDEMKALLMLFQRRLEFPPWPPFYNMLWFSADDLLDYLDDFYSLG